MLGTPQLDQSKPQLLGCESRPLFLSALLIIWWSKQKRRKTDPSSLYSNQAVLYRWTYCSYSPLVNACRSLIVQLSKYAVWTHRLSLSDSYVISTAANLQQRSAKRLRGGRNVHFESVTVYYFNRRQGFTSVPTQGGSTLGMSPRHSWVKRFTLREFAAEQQQSHWNMLRNHLKEEKLNAVKLKVSWSLVQVGLGRGHALDGNLYTKPSQPPCFSIAVQCIYMLIIEDRN